MFFAIYNINTGVISKTISTPYYMPEMFVLEDGFAVLEVEREPRDEKEHIKDGVLTSKPQALLDADKPTKEENQETVWERIKALRLKKMTAGVYVPSIDKHLHTDEVSSIQYAQIGTAIALGMFQPLNWKTIEGDFIEMNEAVFRELQALFIQKTQDNYARAEYHKYMMTQSDNPLDYDYSTGWAT